MTRQITAGPRSQLLEWSNGAATVSLTMRIPETGNGFLAVDLLDGEPARALGAHDDLLKAIADAAPVADTLALEGFVAPAPAGQIPMVFTLAVTLADIPHPEAVDPASGKLEEFGLPCGPGIRIQRLTAVSIGSTAVPVLGATYLAQTQAGVLALAFSTPHVDAAIEFAALFDALAGSCMVS